MEMDDYQRELLFDDSNRLLKVNTKSFFPNDVVLESYTDYTYDAQGVLQKAETDTGYRLEYTWENQKIVRTDEYLDGVQTRYFTFSYDERNRLSEYTTWDDVPEAGGIIPVYKESYLYDQRDNVTHAFLYYYDTGLNGHQLLTTMEFSDYDDMPEGESLFDAYAFNPSVKLRRNNPGKTITRNGKGITNLVDQYSYTYNSRGYPVKKVTTSVFSQSGSRGTYVTDYYYEER